MSTNIEDSSKLIRFTNKVGELFSILPYGFFRLQEFSRDLILLEWLDRAWIEWCFAAFRAGDNNIRMR